MSEATGPVAPPLSHAASLGGRVSAEVERIAQMGSWEWDIAADRIVWSAGLFRIYGLTPNPQSVATYDEYVSRLHPEERGRIQELVAHSRRTGEPFVHVHRIVWPSGEVRTVLGRGEVVRGADGEPARMVGTAQDISERLHLEREVAARLAAEAAAERWQFLADVGVALATTSLDYEQTLRQVASLAVPRVADWCAVDLMYEDGVLHRVAVHHRDPDKVQLVRELAERYPDDPRSEVGGYAAMRRAALLYGDVTDELIDASAVDAEHARILRALELGQFMIAPLIGRDEPIGAISFANDTPRSGHGDEDRQLAEELGRRAGIAIENARLHQIVRDTQMRLQDQAAELEAQTEELEAMTAETETANDELRIAAEALMQRSEEGDAARREITAVLESIGDAFFALDDNWCFTYVNERAERLLERTRSELVGRSIWDEFPEAVGSTFDSVYHRVMSTRVEERFEEYFPPLDNWFAVSAYPAVTGGIAVYFQNVTARRRAELQFSTLAETMPQLVWSTTGEGYHDYYNSRWYEYTGMSRDGSQGWNWKNFLHPDDYERTMEAWAHSLQSGEPYSIEYRFRRAATGEFRWFIGRALPLRDERGRIIRWFGTCTDIDDAKAAQTDRDAALHSAEQARVEAESANRAKADFLATMSHELRTPINAALGYSELLAMGVRGPMTPAQLDDLSRIKRSQRLLLSLVNDILNFARLEAGKIELHLTDVSLDEVLASLDAMIAPQVAAKALRYGQSGCGESVRLRADTEKLQQVLLNLLTNAVKFTGSGGEVELTCSTDDDWVHISVRDTGRGIEPEQIGRVFEPFVQLDRHLTLSSQQGVGLGLAISRDLVRAMGGELTATSAPGVGSTFVARIPRAS
ncbi:MAG: two-component sensor histidine kinase [Gemmatimonadetes bacterium]|nr:two-component sensor histidine kinase [Gemmatimonadota bacterium]